MGRGGVYFGNKLTGQEKSLGRSSNMVPFGMPLYPSPFFGSYTYPQLIHSIMPSSISMNLLSEKGGKILFGLASIVYWEDLQRQKGGANKNISSVVSLFFSVGSVRRNYFVPHTFLLRGDDLLPSSSSAFLHRANPRFPSRPWVPHQNLAQCTSAPNPQSDAHVGHIPPHAIPSRSPSRLPQ